MTESVIDKELAELEQKIDAAKDKAQVKPDSAVETPKESSESSRSVSASEIDQGEASASGNQDDEKFNATEWVKKKGWKTAEDVAKSLHNLEQEFHKKNQELSQLKNQQSYRPPENPYGPPMPDRSYPPPPPYAYPEPSYTPRINEEQIAASYNLSVEDFRKVVAVSRDMAEAQNRRYQTEMNAWRDEMTRQTEKSADMATVLSDPAFHNPEVQYEMHEIISKNPAVFNERRPYSTVLRESLANIGRKNAMRGSNIGSSMFPSQPPKSVGGSSGFSGRKGGSQPTQEEFEKLTPEAQEKVLKSLNAFKTYEDMR